MEPELTVDSTSIVVVGEFMPAVFHPSWLAKNNLMAADEAENAKVEVVHSDATIFNTEWLVLNVRRDRLTATCVRGDSNMLLKDLIIGVLQLFPKSPTAAIGLNRDLHFKMQSEEAWHELGHKLAPKAPWSGILNKPGLLSVQIQGNRDDGKRGAVNVLLQPSVKVKFGTFVQINDHYDLRSDNERAPASAAIPIVRDNWEGSLERANAIAREIVKQ
jgi:hypothetical protein